MRKPPPKIPQPCPSLPFFFLLISFFRNDLEHPNLLKLRSLDSSCPCFPSDTGICGQCSKCYDRKAKLAFRTSKCCTRKGNRQRGNSKCYDCLGKTTCRGFCGLYQGSRVATKGQPAACEKPEKQQSYYGARGAAGIFGEIFLLKNLEHSSGSRFMVRSGLPLSAFLGLA